MEGRDHLVARFRVVTNDEGRRQRIEELRHLKPWWFTSKDKVFVSLRYGARLLAIGKGMDAVELASKEQLVPTLTLLLEAVMAGELDKQIEDLASKIRRDNA
jgi:hypothetical protein